MGDVVDLVFVQADCFDQVDLDFVAGGDAANQVVTGFPRVLGGSMMAGMLSPGCE